MSKELREYSLEALVEHPALRMQMTAEGLERRYLDRILNSGLRRSAEAGRDVPNSITLYP
jgi:hypothetical protein